MKEWCFLCGQLIIRVWPSAVSMQDPIRHPAGWNHHCQPPPIPLHHIYLFPLTSCLWILRIDFYMYMWARGLGLRMRRRRTLGDPLLMCEWRGWGNDEWADWMLVHHTPFSWLQVVSHFLDRHISACLYMTARTRQFACSTDNKRACACQNRWWCVTVSTQCCLLLAWPSTSRHVSFHNQGKGKMGQRNHPRFLPTSFCCRFFRINLIPKPLAMLSPLTYFYSLSVFFRVFFLTICLSLSTYLSLPSVCVLAGKH